MKTIPLALALFCLSAQANEPQIRGPLFDDAKYSLAAVTTEGPTRTVIIKRTGPFFSSYIKQEYDCSSSEYRYLGMGSKSDEIVEDVAGAPWFSLPPGYWLEGVRDQVCATPSVITASSETPADSSR